MESSVLRRKNVEQYPHYPIKGAINTEQKDPSPSSGLRKYFPCIRKLVNPQEIFRDLRRMTTIPSEIELLSYFLRHCTNVRALTIDTDVDQYCEHLKLYQALDENIPPSLREVCLRAGTTSKMSSGWCLFFISQCSSQLAKLRLYIYPDDIFHDRRDEDYQDEPFDMTLDTGLHHLSGLKNLRELDVEEMNQRIGLKEAKWMALHWPNLRVIRGLYGYGNNLEAIKWLREHSPMVELAILYRQPQSEPN